MRRVIVYTMAYNAEKTITRTIESIQSQTHDNWIYYCVDNASTDETGSIISRYAATDSRIIHLTNKENHVWEKGNGLWDIVEQAPFNDYLCVIDADDIYLPDFFANGLEFAKLHQLDVVACGSQLISEKTSEPLNQQYAIKQDLIFDKTNFSNHFPNVLPFMYTIWGKLYSIPTLLQMDLESTNAISYSSDTVFAITAFFHAQRTGIMSDILHHYYIQEQSVIHSFQDDRILDDQACCKIMMDFLEKLNADTVVNKGVVLNSYFTAIANTLKAMDNNSVLPNTKIKYFTDILQHPYTIDVFNHDKADTALKTELLAYVRDQVLSMSEETLDEKMVDELLTKMQHLTTVLNRGNNPATPRTKQMTISLCMIVKNEETNLERCLSSIRNVVDEVIIVDTGSTDGTKEVAHQYTSPDLVYDFEWINDFSAARNFAFSKATMEYIMWIDADDVFPHESLLALQKLKEELTPDVDIITMPYLYDFDADGNPLLTFSRERLFKRENDYRWIDPVHEYIELTGNVLNTNIPVHHLKDKQEKLSTRNIDIYLAQEQRDISFTPRQTFYFAREYYDHKNYEQAAKYFSKFLALGEKWEDNHIDAVFHLSKCYEKIGLEEKILPLLMLTFEYDVPRAEICVQLGFHYQRQNEFAKAYRWFSLATRTLFPENGGFIYQDYWNYIPHAEAAICAYKIGNIQAAIWHNEQAAQFKPDDTAVINNRKLFTEELTK